MTYRIEIRRTRQGFYRLLLAYAGKELVSTRTAGPFPTYRMASGL